MSVHANGVRADSRVEPQLEVPLDRAIRAIELGLVEDDPNFVRDLRRRARGERINMTIVFALLVGAILMLASGLATYSWFALVAGGLAFVGAFAVDDRYRRRARRSPQD